MATGQYHRTKLEKFFNEPERKRLIREDLFAGESVVGELFALILIGVCAMVTVLLLTW